MMDIDEKTASGLVIDHAPQMICDGPLYKAIVEELRKARQQARREAIDDCADMVGNYYPDFEDAVREMK